LLSPSSPHLFVGGRGVNHFALFRMQEPVELISIG
jgi:hypothetical protein